ncbi:MAG: type II secretion system F family protein [Sedimentibacter saalensis]|uniref:type II secretion system F family protein n=1 Tax=Sedimentibacter saalensis TaxID=130788 RepID=UPI0031584CB5
MKMDAYISLIFGILVFCLITIALYNYGSINDKVNKRLNSISGLSKEIVVDEEMDKSLNERIIKPIIQSITHVFSKIIPSGEETIKSEQLRKMLRQAGITILPSEYSALKAVVIIGTAIIFFAAGLLMNISAVMKSLMPVIGAYSAFAILRFNLTRRITKRRELMEQQMPDVLDMISVNVEAGLGFEQAMLHVINHFEGPLIDEFTITYREMTMGRSRREALQLLGTRCNIEDIKSFTGAVIQAGKLGISLKNVLRTQAAAIRQSRRSKIREKAMKISVKMLLPMVAFIFPVIFIVLMGPAVIKIMEMLGGM